MIGAMPGERTDPVTDARAVVESRDDPRAFAVLFDRHHAEIHRYLHRRVGITLADDLAAETFLRAFDARSRYDASHPDARPWLYGIASNLLRRHRRDEVRGLRAFARAGSPDGHDAGLEGVVARLDAAAQEAVLAEALASLPAREREVLLLHAWADLSYDEIAAALDVPVGTVRSRLSRGRERFRARLATTTQTESLASLAAKEVP
jgi:RNA polymerase sigma-70 factor (ECF subfamily)